MKNLKLASSAISFDDPVEELNNKYHAFQTNINALNEATKNLADGDKLLVEMIDNAGDSSLSCYSHDEAMQKLTENFKKDCIELTAKITGLKATKRSSATCPVNENADTTKTDDNKDSKLLEPTTTEIVTPATAVQMNQPSMPISNQRYFTQQDQTFAVQGSLTLPETLPLSKQAYIPSNNDLIIQANYEKYQSLPNDLGQGTIIMSILYERIKYVLEDNAFFMWNGKIWKKAHDKEVDKMILTTSYVQMQQLADQQGFNRKRGLDNGNYKTAANVRNVLSAITAVHSDDIFGHDQGYLCVNNGVIDYKTNDFAHHLPQPHENFRTLHIRKMVNIYFLPGYRDSDWDKFIFDITCGDQLLANFLQKVFGYALIGKPVEQVLFMLTGDGGDGKSTLIQAVQNAIGKSFYVSPKNNILTQRDKTDTSAPRADLMALKEKRYVFISELPKNVELQVAQLKKLVAGGNISARSPHSKDEIEFMPEYVIFIDTNHLPKLSKFDYSVERRIIVIPFYNRFTGDTKNVNILDRLSTPSCTRAILAWLLEGAQMYLMDGLTIPDVVKERTQRYFNEYRTVAHANEDCDSISLFIDECIDTDSEEFISTKKLFEAYVAFCVNRKLPQENSTRFYWKLSSLLKDYKKHTNTGTSYKLHLRKEL